MTMPEFIVKIVREEWLHNWYEFAEVRKEPSHETKRLGEQGHLGITKIVKAKTKAEAEELVLKQNPGFVAIKSDTRRLY